MSDQEQLNNNCQREKKEKCIIVVEDNRGMNKMIVSRLKEKGYQVSSYYSGREFLQEDSKNQDGLLLLDYRLPEMTGKEVIDELKEQSQGQLPFIVMTGYGDERLAVRMMKLGACDYLIKESGFLKLLPVAVERTLEQLRVEEEVIETREELRRREKQFRALVENAPDMIFRFDSEGHILYVNPRIKKELDISPEEMVGRTPRELGMPESICYQVEEMIRDVFYSSREQMLEFTYQTSDG